MHSPKEVIKAWVQAFNDHDAEAAAELYHEHAVMLQVAVGIPIKGRTAIHEDLQKFFTDFPDSYTHIENLFEEGDWAILEWIGGGTLARTDKKFTLRGAGFFQVNEGKIIFQRGYWDKDTWFRQIDFPVE